MTTDRSEQKWCSIQASKVISFCENPRNRIRYQQAEEKLLSILDDSLQEYEGSTKIMKTILSCVKEVGGPQQHKQHQKLSEETTILLMKRTNIKTNSNI